MLLLLTPSDYCSYTLPRFFVDSRFNFELIAVWIKIVSVLNIFCAFQERLSHGIAATGFPGNPHRSPTEFTGHHPYFPPHFPTPSQAASAAAAQHQAAQEVFAAQNPHLAATDPYNVNSLHSFQTSQVQQVLQTISSTTV